MAKPKTETLEWVTIVHGRNGTDVKVTQRRDNVTARWVVRTWSSNIKPAVKEARSGAAKALKLGLEGIES